MKTGNSIVGPMLACSVSSEHDVIQALLELEPPSGQVFPTLCGGRMVMPSAQRAIGALILTAIKSTRLVANANRPEGISAFSVSPILPHYQPPKPSTTRYTNPVTPYDPSYAAHHVEPTLSTAVLQPPGLSTISYFFWVIN